MVGVLPLDVFMVGFGLVRTMFIPGALHGIEASLLPQMSLLKLRFGLNDSPSLMLVLS